MKIVNCIFLGLILIFPGCVKQDKSVHSTSLSENRQDIEILKQMEEKRKLKAESDELENLIADKTYTINNLQKKIDLLQPSLDALAFEKTRLEADLRGLNVSRKDMNDQLKIEIQLLHSDKKDLKKEIDYLKMEKGLQESAVDALASNREKIENELSGKKELLNRMQPLGYPDYKTHEDILGAIIAKSETMPENSGIKTKALKSGKFVVSYNDNDDGDGQFVGYYNLVSEKSYTIDENNGGAIEVEFYPYPLNTYGPFAENLHTEWFLEFRIENNIEGIEIKSSDSNVTDAPVKIFPSPGNICRWRWNIRKKSNFSKNDINLFFKFGYKKENNPEPVFQSEQKMASIMIVPNTITFIDKLKDFLSMGNLVVGLLFGVLSTFFLVKPKTGQTD